MTRFEDMIWCDGCGVEITWGPVIADERSFCCRDCSQGIYCACGERMEIDDEQRSVGAATTPVNNGHMI